MAHVECLIWMITYKKTYLSAESLTKLGMPGPAQKKSQYQNRNFD